jgi:hypothetical protein
VVPLESILENREGAERGVAAALQRVQPAQTFQAKPHLVTSFRAIAYLYITVLVIFAYFYLSEA